MSDNNAQEASAWYARAGYPSPPEAERWYRAGDPIRCSRVPDTRRPDDGAEHRQKRTKRVTLSVCAVFLIIAVAYSLMRALDVDVIFRVWRDAAADQMPILPTIEPEEDTYEDFREYFENYYTTTDEVNMPRAETGTGVTVPLYPPIDTELTLQQIYDAVSPAVVGITTYHDGTEYSWGTGVVFTPDGYIITNTHILQGCSAAEVVFPSGKEYDALLVGADEASDIAVLHIDGEDLPYAYFGRSDALHVGDDAVAIGNPLGEAYAGTMTNGIVSAINRNVVYNGHSMTLLQTNAALNEGNSGGPLVNAAGQVIGITNMKIMSSYTATVEGIGFAIPSSVVKQIADQLIANGIVLGEPTIGIVAGSVSEEARALYGLPEGVYVSEVNEGSDAKAKGLQVGDVIVRVNGEPVSTVAQVNLVKEDLEVGDTLTLTVFRDGETFDLEIALVDRSVIEQNKK